MFYANIVNKVSIDSILHHISVWPACEYNSICACCLNILQTKMLVLVGGNIGKFGNYLNLPKFSHP